MPTFQYQCTSCSETFENMSNRKKHVRLFHQLNIKALNRNNISVSIDRDPTTNHFTCHTCPYSTNDAENIRRHIIRGHCGPPTETSAAQLGVVAPVVPPPVANTLQHCQSGEKNPGNTARGDVPPPNTPHINQVVEEEVFSSDAPYDEDFIPTAPGLDSGSSASSDSSDDESCAPAHPEVKYGLYFLKEYGVLLCLECQTGINPDHLVAHIKKHDTWTEGAELEDILSTLDLIPVEEVALPPADCRPFDNLTILPGFRCTLCPYAAQNRSSMNQHRRVSHQPNGEVSGDTFIECNVQSFFRSKGRRPFPVAGNPDEIISTDYPGLTEELKEEQRRIFQEFHTSQKSRTVVGSSSPNTLSPWLNRAGWTRHLAGIDTKTIRSFMGNYQMFSGHMNTVESALEHMFLKCTKTFDEGNNIQTSRWMSSKTCAEYCPKPFERRELSTEAGYTRVFRKIVLYTVFMFVSSKIFEHPYKDLVRFSPRQRSALNAIGDILKDDTNTNDQISAQLESKVFELSVSIFKQQIREADILTSILLHGVAILGINKHDGSFRTASEISSELAGLQYIGRLVVFRDAYEEHKRTGNTLYDTFVESHHKYLTPTDITPFGEVMNLLAWAKGIGKGESATPDIFWSQEDGIEAISYRGAEIHTDQFRQMVRAQVQRATDQLLVDFGIDTSLVTQASLRKIHDAVSLRNSGYSFMSDHRNSKLFEYDPVNMVFENKVLFSKLIRIIDGEIVWMKGGKTDFLQRAESILESIMVLFHLVGGQPPRGTELMRTVWANSQTSHRNVFVMDGGIMWVTSYHKGLSTLGWSKFIPRFLPAKVAAIYISYIQKILPIVQYFSYAYSESSIATNNLLFSSDGRTPWDGQRLSKALSRISTDHFGQDNCFGIAGYRHIVISISRRYLRNGFDNEDSHSDESHNDLEDEHDLQASHSSVTADKYYGVRGDIVHSLSDHSATIFGRISRAWHKFLFTEVSAVVIYRLANGFNIDDVTPIDSIGRLLPINSPYHPLPAPSIICNSDPRRQYRSIAVQCDENDMTFMSTPESQSSVALFSNGYPCTPRSQGSPSREIALRSRNILRALYGDNARFKSNEQSLSLKLLLQGVTPLIVILPTGGGKSLLFEGPALELNARVTVVIVPFLALRSDLQRRSESKGVSSQEWAGRSSQRDSNIIYVTAEAASKPTFRQHIKFLKNLDRLERVVIDEAHMIIFAGDFREAYANLDWYSALGVQVVYLTATLPKYMEGELCTSSLIKNHTVVRASTNRKNMQYAVCSVPRDRVVSKVRSILGEMLGRHGPADKTIIYARSVAMCESIGQVLSCGIYHSEYPGKDSDLRDWMTNDGGIICATTALGAGIDVATISTIIFANMPHSFVDFAQGSGRAGRDGRPASTWIVFSPEEGNIQSNHDEVSTFPTDFRALRSFVYTNGCRRQEMNSYFDGHESSEKCNEEEGEELCDNCAGSLYPLSENQVSGSTSKGKKRAHIIEITSDDEEYDSSPSTALAKRPRLDSVSTVGPPLGALENVSPNISYYRLPGRVPPFGSHYGIFNPEAGPSRNPYNHGSQFQSNVRLQATEGTNPRSSPFSSLFNNRPQHNAHGGAGDRYPPPLPSSDIDLNMGPDRNSSVEQWWKDIELPLGALKAQCRFCWVSTTNNRRLDHSSESCTAPHESYEGLEFTWKNYQKWRGLIEFAAYSCCYRCTLPQRICPHVTKRCKYDANIIAPVAFMAHFNPQLRNQVKLMMGVDTFTPQEYILWAAELIRFNGAQASNMFKVYCMANALRQGAK